MKFGAIFVHLVALLTKKGSLNLVEGLESYESSFSAFFKDPEKKLIQGIFLIDF